MTYILRRYNSELQTSEMFNTAGRTVKSGLVGSAVVSSWTWAATLLQSSGVCYRYGVSGPFWYASGATVQILLFATLAIELKRRAPNAHTFLEVIKARYGTVSFGVVCPTLHWREAGGEISESIQSQKLTNAPARSPTSSSWSSAWRPTSWCR